MDLKFYKDYVNDIVGGIDYLAIPKSKKYSSLYKFINNDLTGFRKMIEYYCDPAGILGITEEDLVPYNPVVNKLNVLLGEVISRGNTHKTLNLNGKAVKKKNEELIAVYKKAVDQLIQKSTETGGQISDEDVQKMYKENMPATINYLTESEKFGTKLLNYIYYNDSMNQLPDTYKDLYVTGLAIVYAGFDRGKPVMKICNPLSTGFFKSPNEPRISKSDYVWHKDQISIGECMSVYKNRLTEEDLEKLKYSRGGYRVNKPESPYTADNINFEIINDIFNNGEDAGLHIGNGSKRNKSSFIDRVHIEFKHHKKVKFFSFTNELGEKVTIIVDEKFEHPKNASKVKFINRWGYESNKHIWSEEENVFELETLYVPRRYECTILDGDIYVDYREVPFQPDLIENPEQDFTLSYKGIIINNRNAEAMSPIEQALPYAFQYMSVKRVQDNELAKYQGSRTDIDVDQIPDELGEDGEGNALEGQDKLFNAIILSKKTGYNFFSGSKSNNGTLPPSTRTSGISGYVVSTANELMYLQQFANMINAELGIALGIPPQREAQVISGTNVTDNRQALQQSTLVTQVINFHHDSLWKEVYNETLVNYYHFFKNLFLNNDWDNYHYEYITPEGIREFLEVSPNNIESLKDIGVYTFSNGKDKLYFDFMMQSVHALAQNQSEGVETLSEVVKAITSNAGPEEVHEMIKKASIKQQDRQAQMQSNQDKMNKELVEQQRELEMFKSNLKVQEAIAINDAKGNLELSKAAITAGTFAAQADINKNNVNDSVEEAQLKMKHDTEEKAKDREFERQENIKDREIERLKIHKGGNKSK